MPVYLDQGPLANSPEYEFSTFKAACIDAGYRVFYDEDSSHCTIAQSPEIIYDCDTDSCSLNLGGHDLIGGQLKKIMNGESGPCCSGVVLRTPAEMLIDLKNAGVPEGQHRIAHKYHHGGSSTYTGAGANGALLTFTIDSGFASFSAVAFAEARGQFDIAMCACKIGEDCPDSYT